MVSSVVSSVDDITNSISHVLYTHDWRTVEIEFRRGQMTSAGFNPDVGRLQFEAIKNAQESQGKRIGMIQNTTEHTSNGIRTIDHGNRVEYLSKVRMFDMEVTGGRLSVSIEKPEQGSGGPGGYVRRKSRTSFDRSPWRVDMTCVVNSLDNAEDRAKYEVEVELANKDALFSTPLRKLVEDGLKLLSCLSS
jgi:hypothetical protein